MKPHPAHLEPPENASQEHSTTRVVVLGGGYWGINHIRNVHALGALYGICDSDAMRLSELAKRYPQALIFSSYTSVFDDPKVQAVIIATPAVTHFELATLALQAGKDVLVEKPLALKVSQAKELHELSHKRGRILMVGHLLRYHPALVALKAAVDRGDLGELEYFYSHRLNLGKIRTEENILWSFAPHDISLMLWLTQSHPLQVNVVGGSYLTPNVADTTVSSFVFPGGVRGHIFVSWLHPFKEQRLVLVGRKKMAVFDDQAPAAEKLLLFDKQVERIQDQFVTKRPTGTPLAYDASLEPLAQQIRHFLTCIQTRQSPITNAQEGRQVLEVLQACQRSLELNGQSVQLGDPHA